MSIRHVKVAVRLSVVCLAAGGCGSSAPAKPLTAHQVCARLRARMAQLVPGQVTVRVADSDPGNMECVLSAHGVRLDVVADPSPRAFSQYDATVVHQSQAFGSLTGSSPRDLPINLAGLGFNASWVPAKQELIATNATQSTGGVFVTVTVTRKAGSPGPSNERLAMAVVRETLAVAPKAPNPGPPPS